MSKEALDEIERNLLTTQLPLQDTATNLVFGKGNPEAEIMFIGEAPGEKEDLEGKPFVGAAGKQLDGLLNSIGLTLDDVYIANILKYRPPKNRDPNVDEIRTHTPFLVEQINAIKPKVIATLGNFSTKFILAKCDVDGMKQIAGISGLHGREQKVILGDHECLVVPLYHPAAMLYRPGLRATLQDDIIHMGELIGKKAKIEKIQKTLFDVT